MQCRCSPRTNDGRARYLGICVCVCNAASGRELLIYRPITLNLSLVLPHMSPDPNRHAHATQRCLYPTWINHYSLSLSFSLSLSSLLTWNHVTQIARSDRAQQQSFNRVIQLQKKKKVPNLCCCFFMMKAGGEGERAIVRWRVHSALHCTVQFCFNAIGNAVDKANSITSDSPHFNGTSVTHVCIESWAKWKVRKWSEIWK